MNQDFNDRPNKISTEEESRKLFSPWEDFHETEHGKAIGVLEPPCINCIYWQPRRNTECSGVELCRSENQYHDFSCFSWNKKEVPDLKKYLSQIEEGNEALKQALESESAELVKERKKTEMLQGQIDSYGVRNSKLSNINDELEETNNELEGKIETLKECLKAVL